MARSRVRSTHVQKNSWKGKSAPATIVWSASKVTTAENCALQAFFENFLKWRGPTPPYTALGSGLHHMFQTFFTYTTKRRERYFYLDEKTLIKAWTGWWWSALFPDRPAKNGKKTRPHGFGGYREPPEIVTWRDDDVATKCFARGINILKRFYARYDGVRHDGNLHVVEKQFEFWYEGIKYTGRIDRMDITPDGVIIVDYKTKRFSQPVAQTGIQPTYYQFGYEQQLRALLPGQPPLVGLQIYDYNADEVQELPLRDELEIKMLLRVTKEGALYYDGVLNDKSVPPELASKFTLFNPHDIERGNITVRTPRSPTKCQYCQFVQQCRQIERGAGPTVRQMWRDHQLQKSDRAHPEQVRLAFMDHVPLEAHSSVYTVHPKPLAIQSRLEL